MNGCCFTSLRKQITEMSALGNYIHGNDQICIYQRKLSWQYVRWHEMRRRGAGKGVISVVQKKDYKKLK